MFNIYEFEKKIKEEEESKVQAHKEVKRGTVLKSNNH